MLGNRAFQKFKKFPLQWMFPSSRALKQATHATVQNIRYRMILGTERCLRWTHSPFKKQHPLALIAQVEALALRLRFVSKDAQVIPQPSESGSHHLDLHLGIEMFPFVRCDYPRFDVE